VLKAYEYRLYPTQDQQILFAKNFGCVRWIYNWALAKRIEHYQNTKKKIHVNELAKALPKLKADPATDWLSEVNAQSLQKALFDLDTAYLHFFRDKFGFPKFKSKHGKQSFTCPQKNKVDFDRQAIWMVKHGWVSGRIHRKFDGAVRSVTIKKTATGKYFACVLVEDGKELPTPKPVKPATTVGIDLGLTNFITTSNGDKVSTPKYLRKAEYRLKHLNRVMSRKKKGSANRDKARHRLSVQHEKVACRRKDFLHKLTRKLVDDNQVDCYAIETLNVAGMQQNHRLAKSIGDAGWSEFVRQLTYKCLWSGKVVLKIGRFEPSSKMCSCGQLNHNLTLANRTWTCARCGTEHDRDVLAAQNIRRFALSPKNFLGAGSPELASNR
jgi:putative transposase